MSCLHCAALKATFMAEREALEYALRAEREALLDHKARIVELESRLQQRRDDIEVYGGRIDAELRRLRERAR